MSTMNQKKDKNNRTPVGVEYDGVIVIGSLLQPEYQKLAKEFPVHGVKQPNPLSLVRYLSERTGRTPGELLDLWRNNFPEFKRILAENYVRDVETARLVNLSRLTTLVSQAIKHKLVSSSKQIPAVSKELEPIEELNPANTDRVVRIEDLGDTLKQMLMEIGMSTDFLKEV